MFGILKSVEQKYGAQLTSKEQAMATRASCLSVALVLQACLTLTSARVSPLKTNMSKLTADSEQCTSLTTQHAHVEAHPGTHEPP